MNTWMGASLGVGNRLVNPQARVEADEGEEHSWASHLPVRPNGRE